MENSNTFYKMSTSIYTLNDLDGELWANIYGFPDYMVSNLGRVKSIGRFVKHPNNSKRWNPTRILKQALNTYGYLMVSITNDKRMASIPTHILVGRAFIENPNNFPQIAHIDHNRQNPSVSNLMWVTGKENMQQSVRDGRVSRGEGRPASILKEHHVKIIYETRMSYRKLAKIFGVCYSTIQELKSGKNWRFITENLEKDAKDTLPKRLGIL